MTEPIAMSSLTACPEHRRLQQSFDDAVRELSMLHNQQIHALMNEQVKTDQIKVLMDLAHKRKAEAQLELMRHIHAHG